MESSKFMAALEKQLDLFKTANEWPDFISHLTALEATLRMHRFSSIPKIHNLYRRLNQCLNPALPSGVHIKTIDVYRVLVSHISKEDLARDADTIALGLFSFYRHVSLTAIPNYLTLILEFVDSLEEKGGTICRHVVLAVVSGLEEEHGEYFGLSIKILDTLSSYVSKECVVAAVWECMVCSPHLVHGALVYLSRIESAEIEDRGLMAQAFSSALQVKEVLVVRKAFDMLMQYPRGGFFGDGEELIISSVLSLLLTKEMSIAKRVYHWISLSTETDRLVGILEKMSRDDPSASEYFGILGALNVNESVCKEIVRKCAPWAIKISRRTASSLPTEKFFRDLDRRLIWSVFLEMSSEGPSAREAASSIIYAAKRFSLSDPLSSVSEAPLVLMNLLSSFLLSDAKTELENLKELDVLFSLASPPQEVLEKIFSVIKGFRGSPHFIGLVKSFLGVGGVDMSVVGDSEFWGSFFLESAENTHSPKILSLLLSKSTLFLPISDLFRVLWKNHKSNAKVIWKYDKVLDGAFLREIRRTVVDDPWEVSEFIQSLWKENLDGSEYIEVIMHIISYSYEKYELSERVRIFISAMGRKTFRALFSYTFSIINDQRSRDCVEKKVRGADSDGIIGALSILRVLIENSDDFIAFLKDRDAVEEAVEERGSMKEVLDVTSPSTEISGSDILIALLYFLATSGQSNAPLQGECLLFIRMMYDRDIVGSLDFLETSLLLKMISRPGNLRAILKVAALLECPYFTETLASIYGEREEKDEILRFAMERNNGELIIRCFVSSSTAVSRGEREMDLVEKVVHYYCSAEGAECNEEAVMTLSERLLWLYVTVKEKERIKRACSLLYDKNPQVFCEMMILRFGDDGNVSFVDAIGRERRKEVFEIILRIISTPPHRKYSFLEKWIEYAGPSSDFESNDALVTISVIIAQAKSRHDEISLLRFFLALLRHSQHRETLDLSPKILDLSVFIAQRSGSKRPEGVEEREKLNLLRDVVSIIGGYIDVLVHRQVSPEKYSAHLSPIWNTVIFPALRSSLPPELSHAIVSTARSLSRMENKVWKKEFFETLLSPKFFRDSEENLRAKGDVLGEIADKEMVLDLLSRAGGGGFFIRDDTLGKSSILKRIRFVVLSGGNGRFARELPSILSSLSELFASNSPVLVCEAYGIARALCCTIPTESLANLWPVAVGDALGIVRGEKSADPPAVLAALKFLDVVATLDAEELLEFRWIVERLGGGSQEERKGKRVPFFFRTRQSYENMFFAKEELGDHHWAQRHCRKTDFLALREMVVGEFPENQ
jgi:Dopey, N-terminal